MQRMQPGPPHSLDHAMQLSCCAAVDSQRLEHCWSVCLLLTLSGLGALCLVAITLDCQSHWVLRPLRSDGMTAVSCCAQLGIVCLLCVDCICFDSIVARTCCGSAWPGCFVRSVDDHISLTSRQYLKPRTATAHDCPHLQDDLLAFAQMTFLVRCWLLIADGSDRPGCLVA